MTSGTERKQDSRAASDKGRAKRTWAPTGGWPSVWNWGSEAQRRTRRRRDLRDLHGDYSEQVGAHFG